MTLPWNQKEKKTSHAQSLFNISPSTLFFITVLCWFLFVCLFLLFFVLFFCFFILCVKSSQYTLIIPHKAIQLTTKVLLGEVPQLSFLLWQKFCHDKHVFVVTKQKYACRDKTFVMTKLCLSRQNIFVLTKLWSPK